MTLKYLIVSWLLKNKLIINQSILMMKTKKKTVHNF